MKRPHGAARSWPHDLRPGRVALALLVALVATGQRVASPTTTGLAATAAAGGATVTLHPAADATVSASQPGTNFGRAGRLRVNGKPRLDSYLRFTVPAGATGRAVLRLWVVDPTNDGPKIRRSDGPLPEAAVNWDNREARFAGIPVDSGALKAGSWAE